MLLLVSWFSNESKQYNWSQVLMYRCGAIRDLLSTEWDPPKREERFMSLEWGNRKLSLNQLHECKSKARWVMYYIDQGDGANYNPPTPLLLLETFAAVVYLNLVIVKWEWQNLIYSLFRFKHTVRFSVWSFPKGFGDRVKIFIRQS